MYNQEYECLNCGIILPSDGKFCSCACSEDYYYINRNCDTCGGEFWDGGTTCTCENWFSKPLIPRTKLKYRFPDYYERKGYYEEGMLIESRRHYTATNTRLRKKKNIIRRISTNYRPGDDLPF